MLSMVSECLHASLRNTRRGHAHDEKVARACSLIVAKAARYRTAPRV